MNLDLFIGRNAVEYLLRPQGSVWHLVQWVQLPLSWCSPQAMACQFRSYYNNIKVLFYFILLPNFDPKRILLTYFAPRINCYRYLLKLK
jgi:hypothetical protein